MVALQPAGGEWLRWTGRAVFADGAERERLEEVLLNAVPRLRKIYNKKRMMCFTLVDFRAELIPMMPPAKSCWTRRPSEADGYLIRRNAEMAAKNLPSEVEGRKHLK